MRVESPVRAGRAARVWHKRSVKCRVMGVDPLVGFEVVLPVARGSVSGIPLGWAFSDGEQDPGAGDPFRKLGVDVGRLKPAHGDSGPECQGAGRARSHGMRERGGDGARDGRRA
jgi:hypothetical protein